MKLTAYAFLAFLCISTTTFATQCPTKARDSILQNTINYSIDQVDSKTTENMPNQGAIVQHYLTKNQYTSQGYGGKNHAASHGEFSYTKLTDSSAIESGVDSKHGEYQRTLTFTTPYTGTWQQTFSNNPTQLVGSFTLINDSKNLAPDSLLGVSVALTITHTQTELTEGFPSQGIVVQSYGKTNYVAKGIGPETINSVGSYRYTKVSPNTAVEEAIQKAEHFTLPYTMVYTFLTARSGTWQQNFANGTIIFSGTFSTFAHADEI